MDVLGFFLPLTGLLLYDVVVEHKRQPWVNGVLFGILTIAQFFTSTEPLAVAALCAPVGLGTAAVLRRRVLWENRRALVIAAGWAAAVAGVVLAYPVWFAFAGPGHIVGSPWPFNITAPLSGNLGWAIYVFIALSLPLWRTRAVAWCAFTTGLWATVLSWGVPGPYTTGLHAGKWTKALWWPWSAFDHLPLLGDIQTFRFGAVVAFCAAVIMAVSLDELRKVAPSNALLGRLDTKIGATVATVVVLASFAASLALPLPIRSKPTPPWFTHQALALPPGTRVLTIPFAANRPTSYFGMTGTEFMVDQAQDSLRFNLVSGYVVVPGAGRFSVWRQGLRGPSLTLALLSVQIEPPPKTMDSLRNALRQWGVGVTVVLKPSHYPRAVRYLTTIYGRAPSDQSGAAVWYGKLNPPLSWGHFIQTSRGTWAYDAHQPTL